MKVTEFDLNDVIIKKGLKINESDGINACRIILFFFFWENMAKNFHGDNSLQKSDTS